MNQRTIALLGLLVLAVVALVYLGLTDSEELGAPGSLGVSTPVEGAADNEETPAESLPVAAQVAPPDAEGAPAATPGARAEVLDDEEASSAIPADAVWLEGRVVLPEETPHEDSIFVVARGRRLGEDRDAPREHRVRVDRHGRFRVAFAESTRKGWLGLESRYLYLPQRLRIEPKEHEGELVLEPRLGGRVVGAAHLPAGVVDEPASWEGARATVWSWIDEEDRVHRSAEIGVGGAFEFDALPVGGDYRIGIQSPLHARTELEDQVVRRGEVTRVELHFTRGVRVAGTVLDRAGEPVQKGELNLRVTTRTNGSSHSRIHQLPIDDGGGFEESGIEPGEMELTLQAEGYRELVLELGTLEDGDERMGIDLRPELGQSLTGLVRWPDGSPAEGASVRVQQANEEGDFGWDTRDFQVETDEAGRFLVEGLEGRALVVEASARLPRREGEKPGRRTKLGAKLEDVQAGTTGLVLTLGEGQGLSGVVTDDLGRPVERFTVEVQPLSADLNEYETYRERKSRGFRDEGGAFELTGLTAGRYQVRAQARDGGVSGWSEVELPGAAPLELVAPRGVVLRGQVVTPGGEVVRDAKVELEYQSGPLAMRWFQNDDDAERVDETGSFVFEGAAPGALSLKAEAHGWAQSEALELRTEPGSEHEGLRLVLRSAARITGEVHPDAGAVAQRRITVWSDGWHDQTLTDERGHFELDSVPPGSARVHLNASHGQGGSDSDRGAARTDTVQVELTEGETRHILLGAPPEQPVRVHGRVTQGGEAVDGINVLFHESDSRITARTAADGAYSVLVDGARDYQVTVSRGGSRHILKHEASAEPEQRLDIELPTASVAGVVLGPGGEPLSQQIVALSRKEGDRRQGPRSAQTDAEGRFEVEFLEEGEYELIAGHTGPWYRGSAHFAPRVLDGLRVEEGERIADLEFTLGEGCSVQLLVVGSDGLPVAGAWVHARDAAGHELTPYGMGMTDGNGELLCRGLPAGELDLRAREEGGQEGQTRVRCLPGERVDARLVVSEP